MGGGNTGDKGRYLRYKGSIRVCREKSANSNPKTKLIMGKQFEERKT